MGWKEWIVEKLNPAQAGIASSDLSTDPENIADYREAFEKVEVIRRCVEMIINAAVAIPFKIDGGPVGKLTKLLNVAPNPFEDRVRFFRRALLDFFLDGNVFIFRDVSFPNEALFIIPANDMSIVPDKKTFVHSYEYRPLSGDTTPGTFGIPNPLNQGRRDSETEIQPIVFRPEEIIHIKSDSQDSVYRGEPRLKNLERLIELYYALIDFQRQFFKNNAIPGFVLQTDNVLSRNIKERLLAEWRQAHSSITRGGRSPAILDGGLKIDSFSNVNFREMDFENSVERVQEDMAKSLGVPYVLIKSGNNANLAPNQVVFYLFTILPIMEIFASAFQHRFPGSKIAPDKGSVEALRPDIKAQANYWSTLVNGGIATPNEAREGLRLPRDPDPQNDKIRIPQNIAGSAVDPNQGGRPNEPHPEDITDDEKRNYFGEVL